jgi:UDP-N-acetylmuramate: L-alanyl-gamma-D-glutamyl-meso-diaminopimelate ligase
MHIHILGICGTFMGGIAALARERSWRVTGCDAQVYPPMSEQLAALGIELIEGYGAEQLDLRPDCFVIGNALSRGNALVEAILAARRPYTSGAQFLSEQVLTSAGEPRHVLAVAGTHGKTTTSAMLAFVLEAAGLEPGYLIGGVPRDFERSARLGAGRMFVVEADEYDTAFFDKRSKFVHYRPTTLVLNNLEFDHADIFDDLRAIERQFHHLLRTVPGADVGRVIVNGADAALARVLDMGLWSPWHAFGARPPASSARAAPSACWTAAGPPEAFDVLCDGRIVGRVDWQLAGTHNQWNALAAVAAAAHAGVEPHLAAAALGRFQGVRRRLEWLGAPGGVHVYDDFAHHPTAIATTLDGLRRRLGAGARIVAVFEPRSATMRRGDMAALLPQALAGADRAHCHARALGWDARAVLAPLGDRAQVHDDVDTLLAALLREAQPGDHLLLMSNGGFGGLHRRLLAELERRAATAA